jgi:Gas vesicle synthesis protein GvpO
MSQTETRSDQQEQEASSHDERTDDKGSRLPVNEAIRTASRYVRELTGREPDSVSGVGRSDQGWTVTIDVVELQRIPSSTDVMGSYEVLIDDDGELVDFHRGRRFVRSQSSEE